MARSENHLYAGSQNRQHPGLLIDRKYDRALGCLAIQRADRVDLLAELRVRAVQPLPNAVRAHVARLQDALQVTAADPRNHPPLDSTLDQFVQRRRGPALRLGGLLEALAETAPAGAPGAWETRAVAGAAGAMPRLGTGCWRF